MPNFFLKPLIKIGNVTCDLIFKKVPISHFFLIKNIMIADKNKIFLEVSIALLWFFEFFLLTLPFSHSNQLSLRRDKVPANMMICHPILSFLVFSRGMFIIFFVDYELLSERRHCQVNLFLRRSS